MKVLLTILLVFASWIHFAPQLIDYVEARNRARAKCPETYTINFAFNAGNIRFYDIYPLCDQYDREHWKSRKRITL